MLKSESIISTFDGSKYNCKILGQEESGKYLYIRSYKTQQIPNISEICLYTRISKITKVLYRTNDVLNVIQASINDKETILVLVIKTENTTYTDNEKMCAPEAKCSKFVYNVIAVNVINKLILQNFNHIMENQVMVQFLYRKKCMPSMDSSKLLIFQHQKNIMLYEIQIKDEPNSTILDINKTVLIVKAFSWAQWDSRHQCLFYIHNRQKMEDNNNVSSEAIPTTIMSAFQFHDDMPHETVLNIPIIFPLKSERVVTDDNLTNSDQNIPPRIHDNSMNFFVLMHSQGYIYICHHYFKKSKSNDNSNEKVNLVYRVTILHHGSVIHCAVPEIQCDQAIDLKPIFCMYGDQHLLVFVSDLFLQVLDVGKAHEPCYHFIIPSPATNLTEYTNRVPLPGTYSEILDLVTLEIFRVSLSRRQLFNALHNQQTTIHNRCAILHYIFLHLNDTELTKEIILNAGKNPTNIVNVKIFKEFLVCGCYAMVSRQISSDVLEFLQLLPLTGLLPRGSECEYINNHSIILKHETSCNPSVMLLTPRQRLIPFRSDVWTRIWNNIPSHILANKKIYRFKNSQVVSKLAVSLVCYQPEALSRCCTPLTPGVSHIASTGMLADVINITKHIKSGVNPLPFQEVEIASASKQEHVMSVNLREVSLHLMKFGKNSVQVNAVALKFVSSQLEISRTLCSYLALAAGIDTKYTDRGFRLIDQLPIDKKFILFTLMERYYTATETSAFPLPQGFTSFFTYLAYKNLSFEKFTNYVRLNIVQVNIDVMKAIMAELSDDGEEFEKKINLLVQLPRSRVKRILNQWQHPASLMIRAREHSTNILVGVSGIQARASSIPKNIRQCIGLSAFHSNERLSPLDTFLNMLTAKASLAEIDFNLLINATVTSTAEFIIE